MVQLVLVAGLVALDLAAPIGASSQVEQPDTVTVRITGGFVNDEDEVRLRRIDQRYVDELHRDVAKSAVLELSKELSAPAPSLDLSTTGITVQDIRRRAERLLASSKLPPWKKRELRARMEDTKAIEQLLASRFQFEHGRISDSVRCTVVIRYGAREVTATTKLDNGLALPWQVGGRTAWNSRISDAVSELMPDREFFNRVRPSLSIDHVSEGVAKDVLRRAAEGTLSNP